MKIPFHFSTAFLLLLAVSLTLGSCKKDEDETEQEVITTVVLTLTANGVSQTYEWNDADGDGGNAPVIDEISLPANATDILCSIAVLNRSETPEEDITTEIQTEDEEHLFVFKVGAGLNLTVADNDTDSAGKPFRLNTRWSTGAASEGSLNVVLIHEPDKDAADPSATGETDFDVTFPVKIQ